MTDEIALPTPAVTLNKEQDAAVQLARWLSEKPGRIGILSGPAGSGKTTCLRAIKDMLIDIAILAPTNRAALRAAAVSGGWADTIHSYIYKPKEINGRLVFARKLIELIPRSRLVVVDESSMVNQDLVLDLLPLFDEIGVSILFVGDSFQLPPVSTTDDEFSVFSPSFYEFVKENAPGTEVRRVDLVQVMRQALESPILRGATDIRMNPTSWPAMLEVIQRKDFPKPLYLAERIAEMYEQGIDYACITYTNAMRHTINAKVRRLRGWGEDCDPVAGEPMLVRSSLKKHGIFNGEIIPFNGYVHLLLKGVPKKMRFSEIKGTTCMINREGVLYDVETPRDLLKGALYPFVNLNFGYAITCHASQGCEYDWVVVNWERAILSMPLPTRMRWLYTAFTRAKEKLFIGGLA